jgi:hypothetical protein
MKCTQGTSAARVGRMIDGPGFWCRHAGAAAFPRSISMPFHLEIEVAVVGAMPEMIRRFSMLVFLDFWIPGNDDPINGGLAQLDGPPD